MFQFSIFKKFKKISFLLVIFALCPAISWAAVLYLEPASGKYYQDDIFIVGVRLDTEGEEINAVKIDLVFSQNLLEVKDFSQGDSVLSFWPEKPTFSNREGIISFVGGVPRGFQGDELLGKLVFQTKKSGELFSAQSAEVKFLDDSQVLLNDGLGTPAELTIKEAVFTILPEKLEVPRDEWQKILKEDNILPEFFEIIVAQDSSMFDGRYFIVFSTTDKQTGIDYYEVAEVRPGAKLRETEHETALKWKRAESPYLLEDQELKSIIKVKAVDKAGNERIVEWVPPKKPFPYWVIIITIVSLAIIFLAAKRNLKLET